MKKIISLIILTALCFSFTACGAATLSGDPVSYSNANKSFSIDLPTKEKGDWVKNKKVNGDVLDISNADDTINVQIQCLSKSQAVHIATDLKSYQDYTMTNTLGELAPDMKLKEEKIDLPDFAKGSICQTFTLKNGSTDVKGDLVFMESDACFYAVVIMAVDKAFDANKNVFNDCIKSIKEL